MSLKKIMSSWSWYFSLPALNIHFVHTCTRKHDTCIYTCNIYTCVAIYYILHVHDVYCLEIMIYLHQFHYICKNKQFWKWWLQTPHGFSWDYKVRVQYSWTRPTCLSENPVFKMQFPTCNLLRLLLQILAFIMFIGFMNIYYMYWFEVEHVVI